MTRSSTGRTAGTRWLTCTITTWGDGEPVIFVHGSFVRGGGSWAAQRPLAERYRLRFVDRRGYGDSPPTDGEDFDRDADDIAGLLDVGAHLVGHSYGAVACLVAAGRRPDAIAPCWSSNRRIPSRARQPGGDGDATADRSDLRPRRRLHAGGLLPGVPAVDGLRPRDAPPACLVGSQHRTPSRDSRGVPDLDCTSECHGRRTCRPRFSRQGHSRSSSCQADGTRRVQPLAPRRGPAWGPCATPWRT